MVSSQFISLRTKTTAEQLDFCGHDNGPKFYYYKFSHQVLEFGSPKLEITFLKFFLHSFHRENGEWWNSPLKNVS